MRSARAGGLCQCPLHMLTYQRIGVAGAGLQGFGDAGSYVCSAGAWGTALAQVITQRYGQITLPTAEANAADGAAFGAL